MFQDKIRNIFLILVEVSVTTEDVFDFLLLREMMGRMDSFSIEGRSLSCLTLLIISVTTDSFSMSFRSFFIISLGPRITSLVVE